MRVFWSSRAKDQLRSIFEYLAERNLEAGYRIRDRIAGRVGELKDHPHLGRPGKVAGTRELAITATPYIVAYRVRRSSREIEIAAIKHAAQRGPNVFE